MSIFKSSFPNFVDSQLRIREAILKQGNKPGSQNSRFGRPKAILKDKSKIPIQQGAFYTNTVQKQCTLRMSSGVNMTGKYNGKNYVGNELAKLLVLEGGVPQEDGRTPREGFTRKDQKGNAYGDPNIFADGKNGFGITPMPGITDASIRTVTQYGSLRIAKVNFQVHNQRQLNILERLYMRPGFPILLEWQWTPYINNKGKIIKSFPTLNEFWKNGASIENIQGKISENTTTSGGNYDGFLGVCKNFDFSARPDGGYQCSTEIVAMGEVLDGLKTPHSGKVITKEGKKTEMDDFELYLTAIKDWTSFEGDYDAIRRNEELNDDKKDEEITKLFNNFKERDNLQDYVTNLLQLVASREKGSSGKSFEKKNLSEYELGMMAFSKAANLDYDAALTKANKTGNLKTDVWGILNLEGHSVIEIVQQLLGDFIIEKGQKMHYEHFLTDQYDFPISPHTYIRWDFLASIMNKFIFPHYQKDKPICKLEWYKKIKTDEGMVGEYYEYTHYSLTRNDKKVTVKRDEKTRLSKNGKYIESSEFDVEKLLDASYSPDVCLLPDQIYHISRDLPTNPEKLHRLGEVTKMSEGVNYGKTIGNIWLNVDHLLKVYREMKYSESGINKDFNLLHFLQKIWEKDVNEACGGTHNFMVNTDPDETNKIRIIDYGFDTKGLLPKDLYTFDIQSNETIVRDFNFNSQIPSALSSTMAVLAQNPDSINDIDSVTASALNRGLKSRFFISQYEGDQQYYNRRLGWEGELKNKANDLLDFARGMFHGVYDSMDTDDDKTNIAPIAKSRALNYVKRIEELVASLLITYPLTGEDLKPFKIGGEPKSGVPRDQMKLPKSSIIPLKFQAKLDGIGGIVMGGIFGVKKDKLPISYQANDDIAFIVHALTHTITAGQDWTTEISGQMTLLDVPLDVGENEGIIISPGDPVEQIEGTRPDDTQPTPMGDLLRTVLYELDYIEKGDQITNNGDITRDLVEYAAAVLDKIAKELPEVTIKVTAGNDSFHANSEVSRHKSGRALDFVIEGYDTDFIKYEEEKFDNVSAITEYQIATILKILRQFSGGGEEDNCIFLNEYPELTRSPHATGPHFHISILKGSEGTSKIQKGDTSRPAQNKTGIILADGTGGMGNLELSQLLVKEGKDDFYDGKKIQGLNYKNRWSEKILDMTGFTTTTDESNKIIFAAQNPRGENNVYNIKRGERTYIDGIETTGLNIADAMIRVNANSGGQGGSGNTGAQGQVNTSVENDYQWKPEFGDVQDENARPLPMDDWGWQPIPGGNKGYWVYLK